MNYHLRLFIGEAFISIDEEGATSYQERMMEEKQEELEKQNEQLEEAVNEMKQLKSYLYAIFGNSINLEDEP